MSKDIGKTLKECRIAAKISVKQISDILTAKGFKASESTIYSWENNNSQPTPGALFVMCDTYGIDDILRTFGYNGYREDGSLQLNINEVEIIEKYRVLDEHGRDMVDTVLIKEYDRCITEEKITGIDRSYLIPNAAHERTDIDVTDEMIRHDDDIMNNF